jgi:hypothetical protein
VPGLPTAKEEAENSKNEALRIQKRFLENIEDASTKLALSTAKEKAMSESRSSSPGPYGDVGAGLTPAEEEDRRDLFLKPEEMERNPDGSHKRPYGLAPLPPAAETLTAEEYRHAYGPYESPAGSSAMTQGAGFLTRWEVAGAGQKLAGKTIYGWPDARNPASLKARWSEGDVLRPATSNSDIVVAKSSDMLAAEAAERAKLAAVIQRDLQRLALKRDKSTPLFGQEHREVAEASSSSSGLGGFMGNGTGSLEGFIGFQGARHDVIAPVDGSTIVKKRASHDVIAPVDGGTQITHVVGWGTGSIGVKGARHDVIAPVDGSISVKGESRDVIAPVDGGTKITPMIVPTAAANPKPKAPKPKAPGGILCASAIYPKHM